MRIRVFALILVCGLAGAGCTTISANSQSSVQDTTQEALALAAPADALVEGFTKRGWAAKPDTAGQISKFTQMLTKGIRKSDRKAEVDPVETYLAKLGPAHEQEQISAALLRDIMLARTELTALNGKVERFAATPGSIRAMRSEMLALEQAVLAARKANKLFNAAVRRLAIEGPKLHTALHQLDVQIDQLAEAANDINQRRQTSSIG